MKHLTTHPSLFFCIICVCLLIASSAQAETLLREVSWSQLQHSDELSVGKVISSKEGSSSEHLRIENLSGNPSTVTILVIDNPGISMNRYAIHGKVSYQGVTKPGYLEMWNHFSSKQKFFTRTLADVGPMQKFEGSADWRPFVLPFSVIKGDKRPSKLEINLILPGNGTVLLGPLSLSEYTMDENPVAIVAGLNQGNIGIGFIGSILGVAVGLVGGLIGWMAAKEKRPALVIAMVKGMIGLGIICLILGLLALAMDQPYAVYYPLLLVGCICTFVFAFNLRPLQRRFEALELRKMRAHDV